MKQDSQRRANHMLKSLCLALVLTVRQYDTMMLLTALRVCAAGKTPCDILLLFAASEGDAPKVIELLAAGADTNVKVS